MVGLKPRLPQVHAHIISYLKQEMPSVFRKDNKKKSLIYQLPVIFSKIQLQHNISAGDFPDCVKMQVRLPLSLLSTSGGTSNVLSLQIFGRFRPGLSVAFLKSVH